MRVSGNKSFLLRMDKKVLEALQRWARDDLRSLNGQVEWILRESLRKSGRYPKPEHESHSRV